MFGFFKDKFNNLKETVANTASALVNNVVETISNEEEFSEFVEYKNYLYIENNDNNAYDFRYEITKQEIN